jgi:hypothetical protein
LAEYTDLLPEDSSPSAIEEDIYSHIQARWPNWEPSEGQLETWLIRGFALRISEQYGVAIDVADEIFARFGAMLGRPRHSAQAATVMSTWTMVDDAGYYVPQQTLLSIARSGNETSTFLTAADLTVPQGSTTGQVALTAQEEGAAANGLTATPTLIDALAVPGGAGFVDSITLDSATAGGVDEEDMTAYLDRLAELLTLLTPRPILPADFEILARQEPGVYRAVAIDGLDPGDNSTNNERMVAVAVMDEAGDPLPGGSTAGTKGWVEDRLDEMRETNFVVHVIDADYTEIDVATTIVTLPEYEHSLVVAQVETALEEYLGPINWGRRGQREWVNSDTVRYLEVAEVINRVLGVDYISALTINEDGASPGTTDVALSGTVPVTKPGAITAA